MDEEKTSAPGKTANSPWLKTIAGLLLYTLIYYAIFREFKHVLLLLIVIIIHEGGHFIVMKTYGYRDIKMFFIPFLGAYVTGKSQEVNPALKAKMILAGPLPGIFIGTLLFCIYLIKPHPLLFEASALFLLLNGFNLLPVSPLDGGQLLQTLYFGNNLVIQFVFLILSALLIIAFSLILHNYLMLIIVLFPAMRIRSLWGQIKMIRFIEQEGVDRRKNFDDYLPEEQLSIRKILLKFFNEPASAIEDKEGNDEITALARTLLVSDPSFLSIRSKIYFTLIWLCGLIFPLIAGLYMLTVK